MAVSGNSRLRKAFILLAAVPLLGVAVTMGFGAALDEAGVRALALTREGSPAWLISAAQGITWIGDEGRRAFFLLLFGAILAFQRRPRAALVMIIAPVLANICSGGLKALFDRPRPSLYPHLDQVGISAYPSGHATSGAALFVLAALLIPIGSARLRITCAATIALLIGISRPMLGVHWPTDVIGGWMLGTAIALLGAEIVRRMERS